MRKAILIFLLFSLTFLSLPRAYASETLERQISQSSDDCQKYSSSSFSLNYAEESIGISGTTWNEAGFRFNNITIPKGRNIYSAYLVFVCKTKMSALGSLPSQEYRTEASDNATTFTDLTDFDARSRSSDYITMSQRWSTNNATYTSNNLWSIIDDVINRENWESGNSLVVFWKLLNTPTRANRAWSYDSYSTYAVKLQITYSSYYSITFYQNHETEGTYELNPCFWFIGSDQVPNGASNGTAYNFLDGDTVEIIISANGSYIFDYFNFLGSNYTDNPIMITLPQDYGNTTIWAYTTTPTESEFPSGLVLGGIFAGLIGVIAFAVKKRH